MAKPTRIDRKYAALKNAAEALMVDWDTVIILTTKYDPTHDRTMPGEWSLGNAYAIEAQVKEWVRFLEDSDGMGVDCSCPTCNEPVQPGPEVEMDDVDEPDDEAEDAFGNH